MDIEGTERVAPEGERAVVDRTEAVYSRPVRMREDGVADMLETFGFAVSRLDGRNYLARRGAD